MDGCQFAAGIAKSYQFLEVNFLLIENTFQNESFVEMEKSSGSFQFAVLCLNGPDKAPIA